MRAPESLAIEFAIVGGGITGLTSAIALVRAGHGVTLFERGDDFNQTALSGGCRLLPTATKVFYSWGMEEKFKACSCFARQLIFLGYESGEPLGGESVERDMFGQTGGEYLLIPYAALRKLLYETALEQGVTIRTLARISAVTPHAERPSVTLESGEVFEADVVIGADGLLGLTRKIIVGQDEKPRYLGENMWHATMSDEGFHTDPSLRALLPGRVDEANGVILRNWFSDNGYGVLAFAMGMSMFSLFVYTPGPPDQDLTIRYATVQEIADVIGKPDPMVLKLLSMAETVILVPMAESARLEDWLHPDGRLLVLGEAAHPLHAGSLYAASMAVGDGHALGRIFYHLQRKDQIDAFLGAVQEIRQKHVEDVNRISQENVYAMALPAGIEHGDAKNKDEALSSPSHWEQEEHRRNMLQEIFQNLWDYDPEGEADNWYLQWGLLKDRAAGPVSYKLEIEANIDERVSNSLEGSDVEC